MTSRCAQTLKAGPMWMIVVITLLLTVGCVTKESYTQQVNRTTNLQRLLAEEEKRSTDLTADVVRLKRQTTDLEAQNKLLSDQLKDARAQVVRSLEEVGKLQEEVQTKRVSKTKRAVSPAPTEPPDRLDELQLETPTTPKKSPRASARIPESTRMPESARMPEDTGGSLYHEVKIGDTLYNIAKRYKTSVKALKELNGLTSDEIELGQRLQVRKE